MKILVISDHDRIIGGAERFLDEVFRESAEEPFSFERISVRELIRDPEEKATRLSRMRHRWLPDVALVHRLRQLILDRAPSLIHVNTNSERTASVFAALKGTAVPVVVFVHDAWMLRRVCTPFPQLRMKAFRFMTHHVDYHRQMSKCGLHSWLVRVPFRSSAWTADTVPLAKNYDLLYAGRIDREKGVDLFLEAAGRLVRDQPGLRIAMAGEAGPWLDRQMRRRGISANVSLLGRLPDTLLSETYRRSRLLVLPSACESLGYVGLEAQCSGLPVVAFSNAGTRRWCADGQTGFLVHGRSAAALARRIRDLLGDDDLLLRVADQARVSVGAGGYNASVLPVAAAWRAILHPC